MVSDGLVAGFFGALGSQCPTSDLAKTVKVWQPAAILKYRSSSHTGKHARGDEGGQMRPRGEKVHEGTVTLAGWSDAAYGDQA